jgi:hypothetical protein
MVNFAGPIKSSLFDDRFQLMGRQSAVRVGIPAGWDGRNDHRGGS